MKRLTDFCFRGGAVFCILIISVGCGRLPLSNYLPGPSSVNAGDGQYNDRVVLSWSGVSGAVSYNVYRSDVLDGAFLCIGESSETTFTDTTIELQKTFYYKITTIARDKSEGSFSQIDTGYSDVTPNTSNLQASNGVYSNKVSLSWDIDDDRNISYLVFRSDTADGTYEQIARTMIFNFNDTTAEPGKPYYYKVQGISIFGKTGVISNYDIGYALLSAPSLSVSKGTDKTKISISWNSVSGAVTYTLYRASSSAGPYSIISEGTGLSFDDASVDVTGTHSGADFYYKVTATSAYGLEGFSSSVDSGYVLLSTPSALSATDGSYNDRVVLTWDAVLGASNYAVYRSDSIQGPFVRIGSADAASYNDTDVDIQKPYYYKVSAIAHETAEGEQSTIDSGYADISPSIINLKASNGTYSAKVSLSWNIDEAGNATYKVYRSESASGTFEQIAEPTATSYDDASIEPGKPYYYKVQGISVLGNMGQISNYDNGFATLPAPLLSASKGTFTAKIQLQWPPISYASLYRLYRSDAPNGVFTEIYSGTDPSYSDTSEAVTGEHIGADFYYKVVSVSAYNLDGLESSVDSGYVFITVPSNLTASNETFYNVVLNWVAVPDASLYKVYRLNGSQYTCIASVTEHTYSDNSVTAGNVYSYKVSAIRGGHETEMSNVATGAPKDPAAKLTYRIFWNANRQKGVNRPGGGYRIYYSKNSDFSGALMLDVPYQSGDLAPVSGLLKFTQEQKGLWHIRVTAYTNISGGKESPASSVITVTVE